MPDDTIKLDMNVNLTVEMEQSEWDRLLAEAEEDEDRNAQDTPEEHVAMNLASDFEGEDISGISVYGAAITRAWIATADPPTVI